MHLARFTVMDANVHWRTSELTQVTVLESRPRAFGCMEHRCGATKYSYTVSLPATGSNPPHYAPARRSSPCGLGRRELRTSKRRGVHHLSFARQDDACEACKPHKFRCRRHTMGLNERLKLQTPLGF